jgi:hypothetical protein
MFRDLLQDDSSYSFSMSMSMDSWFRNLFPNRFQFCA